MIQVFQIDEKGYYIKPINIIDSEDAPANYVEMRPPNGLYRAKWNGTEWVEDMSEEEIEEMYNKPKSLTENEMLMLAVAELDMQREQDKIETQLAIADLVETILGGVE